MEKIVLFKRRSFSETIDTSFDLLRQNFKLVSLSYGIFVLPFVLLSTMMVSFAFAETPRSHMAAGAALTASIPFFFVTLFIEAVVIHEIITAYCMTDTPQSLTARDIWVLIKKDSGKLLVSVLGLVLVLVVFLLVAGIASVILMVSVFDIFQSKYPPMVWAALLVLVILYFHICMSHFVDLRLREDCDVLSASIMALTTTIGRWRWLRTLTIYFIMLLITAGFLCVGLMPFMLLIFLFKQHMIAPLSEQSARTFGITFLSILSILSGVIFSYVYQLVLLGTIINYYSIIEEKEYIGLQSDIGNIGLADESIKIKRESEY